MEFFKFVVLLSKKRTVLISPGLSEAQRFGGSQNCSVFQGSTHAWPTTNTV